MHPTNTANAVDLISRVQVVAKLQDAMDARADELDENADFDRLAGEIVAFSSTLFLSSARYITLSGS